jgi:hypothetical protein
VAHCATDRKVAGSIPDGLTGFVVALILLVALWTWDALSLLTEMSTGVIFWEDGVKTAGA